MKKLVILGLIVALVLPGLVLAQGELTETYDDGILAFDYPAGWFVGPDDKGGDTILALLETVEYHPD